MSGHASVEEKRKKRSAAYRISIIVAIVLAIITVLEYFLSHYTTSAIVMFLIGLVKAYAIVVKGIRRHDDNVNYFEFIKFD